MEFPKVTFICILKNVNGALILDHLKIFSKHLLNGSIRMLNKTLNYASPKIYLIETNDGSPIHFDLLGNVFNREKNINIIAELQAIYQKEGLPFTTQTRKYTLSNEFINISNLTQMANITQYQPSIQDVQKKINSSSRRSFWARNAIDTAATLGIAAAIYYKFFKK